MHFYLRFFSLQLLGILLANRSTVVQGYVLTAAGGVGRLVETLDDSREIIRNGERKGQQREPTLGPGTDSSIFAQNRYCFLSPSRRRTPTYKSCLLSRAPLTNCLRS